MPPNISIYTTELSNTHPNITPLGLVIATAVESVSLARAVGDDFMTIFGGSSGLMRTKMNKLIANAISNLKQYVAREFPRANAVYGVKFHFNTVDAGNPEITKAGAKTIRTLTQHTPNLGILSKGANIVARANEQVARDKQTRGFELVILGTAVIEKLPNQSKTRKNNRLRK
jgi:uncharacterized protein YbjQ (UPF0145 family)